MSKPLTDKKREQVFWYLNYMNRDPKYSGKLDSSYVFQAFNGVTRAQSKDLFSEWENKCNCKFPGFDCDSPDICPTCHKPHRAALA